MVLQFPDETADRFRAGGDVLLWNGEEDRPSGVMTVAEVFRMDLMDSAAKIYATTERKHPGVDRWLSG